MDAPSDAHACNHSCECVYQVRASRGQAQSGECCSPAESRPRAASCSTRTRSLNTSDTGVTNCGFDSRNRNGLPITQSRCLLDQAYCVKPHLFAMGQSIADRSQLMMSTGGLARARELLKQTAMLMGQCAV